MERERFGGKVALITGGGSGIGQAVATRLAADGARVVIGDVSTANGEAACRHIEREGGRALFVQCDVTKSADVERLINEAVSVFGRLDLLFTGAGIGGGGSILKATEDEWDRLLALDLKGVFLTSKYAVQAMLASGGGSIVHIASQAVKGTWGGAAFSAAKGGVLTLTTHMAVTLATQHIRVNCVIPGVIETPLTQKWLADPANRAVAVARHPMARLGTPAEVANVVCFLLSEEASFVTGAIVPVDGGSLA